MPEGSEQRLVISNPGPAPMNFTVVGADAADPAAAPLMAAALPAWLQVMPLRGTVPARAQLALQVGGPGRAVHRLSAAPAPPAQPAPPARERCVQGRSLQRAKPHPAPPCLPRLPPTAPQIQASSACLRQQFTGIGGLRRGAPVRAQLALVAHSETTANSGWAPACAKEAGCLFQVVLSPKGN